MFNFILSDKLFNSGTDTWDETISLNDLPTTAKKYRKAPVNWNKLQYAFTRNQKYFGLFPTFTVQLGFTNGYPRKVNFPPNTSDGAKSWIDNLFWVRGINGEIGIVISAFNAQTHQFETFVNGMGNFETIQSKQFQTELQVIDPLFVRDILNKDSIDFDYQQMTDSYSVNHAVEDIWDAPKFDVLRIYGNPATNSNTGYIDNAVIVYPFQLFERLTALITGKRNAFCSSFFAKAGIDRDENGDLYTVDGEGAFNVITTGRFIRGYKYGDLKSGTGTILVINGSDTIIGTNSIFLTELSVGEELIDINGNKIGIITTISDNNTLTLYNSALYDYSGSFRYQNPSDSSTLILSLDKVFKSFSAIYGLGLTIKTNNNGFNYVSIEKIINFYDNNVSSVIKEPKDLVITFDEDWRYNELEVGYNKFQKNPNNVYGNSEYNNKASYVIPTKFVAKKLSLTSDIRTDTTGIQLCLDNLHNVNPDDQSQNIYDTEIFIISSYNDGTRLRSRNNQNGITVMPGTIYGDPTNGDYSHNLELSPARMVYNWGSIIRTMIDGYQDSVLQFQNAEELTRLATKLSSETHAVSDCANIPIKNLDVPFLSGYEANFSSPFGIEEIFNLKNNPFGLIKFWDNISNVWRYGWVKEVSTEPIDKKTNWKIAIASSHVTPIEKQWKLKILSGLYLEMLSGGDILLINQN